MINLHRDLTKYDLHVICQKYNFTVIHSHRLVPSHIATLIKILRVLKEDDKLCDAK